MADQKILNTLVRGAGYGFLAIIISKFLTYFYRAVVARIGPDVYGQLSLAITVFSIAGTITLFSLKPALQTFIPKFRKEDDWASIKGTVLSALGITLTLSTLGAIAVFLTAETIALRVFESPGLTPLIKIFALIIPFSNLSTIMGGTMKGFKKAKYPVFLFNVLTTSTQLVVTLILILLGYGVIGAAWGWAVGVVIPSLVAVYIVEKKIGPILSRKVSPEYKFEELVLYSYPLLLAGIIGQVLGWTDTLLLGYYMNDAQVGFYNAALPTAALLAVVERGFGQLSLPSMAEISDDKKKLASTLKTLTRWNTAVVLPGFLLMVLFSDQILHLLFGKQYVVAGTALAVLAFGKLYAASIGYVGDVLQAIEETQIFWKNSILSFFLNVGLNVLLIPGFSWKGTQLVPALGITGAAIATTASLVIMQTVVLLEAYYFKGVIPVNRKTWKSVAASGFAVAVTYGAVKFFFPVTPIWALVPGAVLFGTVYVLGFLLLGGIEEEDRGVVLDAASMVDQREKGEKLLDFLERFSLF